VPFFLDLWICKIGVQDSVPTNEIIPDLYRRYGVLQSLSQ